MLQVILSESVGYVKWKALISSRDKNHRSKRAHYYLVSTDAEGFQELPLSTIRKSKQPCCFWLVPWHVPYSSQKIVVEHHLDWELLQWGSLTSHSKKSSSSVAVMMKNCEPHRCDLVDERDPVKTRSPSSNCTAGHQPIDLGTISTWKARHRFCHLNRFLRDTQSSEKRRKHDKNKKTGMNYIKKENSLRRLDVSRLVQENLEGPRQDSTVFCQAERCICLSQISVYLSITHGNAKKSMAMTRAPISSRSLHASLYPTQRKRWAHLTWA